MSITTLVIVGMVEIFLIACMWLNTWKQVNQMKMLQNMPNDHLARLERMHRKVMNEKHK